MRKLIISVVLLSQSAAAHEFWIEPLTYQVDVGANLVGHLANGEIFEGTRIPFWRGAFRQFQVVRDSQVHRVPGRHGSLPALNMLAPGEGLNVVVYESRLARVSYESLAEFAAFAEQKGFPDIEARHEELGYPLENFTEIYTRYAKSLIAVGNGAGSDRREGLETEIVALTNPYTDDLKKGMRVQVLYQGEPRAKALVEVFEKTASGAVEATRHRTDAEGIAAIPVKPGRSYLFDAVVLRVPAPDLARKQDAAWETLWASPTFAVP